MNRRWTVPMKACPMCRRQFHPRNLKRANNPNSCCSQSCASKWNYRRVKIGKKLIAGSVAKRREQSRRHIEALVLKKYGELSIREIELFNLGSKVGYGRGYGKAFQQRRRDERQAQLVALREVVNG